MRYAPHSYVLKYPHSIITTSNIFLPNLNNFSLYYILTISKFKKHPILGISPYFTHFSSPLSHSSILQIIIIPLKNFANKTHPTYHSCPDKSHLHRRFSKNNESQENGIFHGWNRLLVHELVGKGRYRYRSRWLSGFKRESTL